MVTRNMVLWFGYTKLHASDGVGMCVYSRGGSRGGGGGPGGSGPPPFFWGGGDP